MGKRGKQIAVTHSLKAANNLTPSGPGIAMIGPMRDVSAVEHNCYPILECKPVLEFSVLFVDNPPRTPENLRT